MKRKSPSGDLKQETYCKHPVLMLWRINGNMPRRCLNGIGVEETCLSIWRITGDMPRRCLNGIGVEETCLNIWRITGDMPRRWLTGSVVSRTQKCTSKGI